MTDDVIRTPDVQPAEPLLPFSGLLAMLEPLDEFRGTVPHPRRSWRRSRSGRPSTSRT
ncbi:hypothetical protein [Cellulomonas sp. JZ18]|uniref:hypothetical protein n=1 Tax=Cellulomonas sp. JZ18 TaxID=2654191 RepID=UPI0012D419A2|nr:hypothetical protein [Cellulomonas sp. JZ18]